MEKRAIVVFPEFDGLHLIEQLRRRFDPLASVIKAHITLVFPFTRDLATEQLHSHIQWAVHDIYPFQVWFQGITGHEGGYLFLNVTRGNDRFIELHDRLYSGVLAAYLSAEHTYVPHVTVGHLTDRTAFLAALEATRVVNTSFQATVSEVTLYQIAASRPIEFSVRL
jgi:2'-5' RNA ligase